MHDVRQAEDTIASAKAAGARLLVAYGNDHVAGVSSDDGVVLVDAGTAGASGYEAIGSASPTAIPVARAACRLARNAPQRFQLIDFSRDDPRRPSP